MTTTETLMSVENAGKPRMLQMVKGGEKCKNEFSMRVDVRAQKKKREGGEREEREGRREMERREKRGKAVLSIRETDGCA